jgi:hypothetical protein
VAGATRWRRQKWKRTARRHVRLRGQRLTAGIGRAADIESLLID